tara:strand:+ start:89595 stop:89864 length:270 start_codon:yes stop_codon:yes gene_type:complete
MNIDNRANYSEPQSRSPSAAAALTRRINTVESIKDPRKEFGWNIITLIFNGDLGVLSVSTGVHQHFIRILTAGPAKKPLKFQAVINRLF